MGRPWHGMAMADGQKPPAESLPLGARLPKGLDGVLGRGVPPRRLRQGAARESGREGEKPSRPQARKKYQDGGTGSDFLIKTGEKSIPASKKNPAWLQNM